MHLYKIIIIFVISTFLTSCNDKNNEENKTEPKQVESLELNLDTFKDYCMLTLKQDYELKSNFDKPLLKAKTGDKFLITDLPRDSSKTEYEVMIPSLENNGDAVVDSTKVNVEADCDETNAFSYLVALTDFAFYADKDLKTELCKVKKGLMYEGSPSGGYRKIFEDENPDFENSLYEVQYDGYKCGSQSTYYYGVPSSQRLPFTKLYSKKWMETDQRTKIDLNSALYSDYCKITLEQDYTFLGLFDRPAFGGKSGESFLVSSESGFETRVYDPFGEDTSEIDSSKAKFNADCEQYEESSLMILGDLTIYSDDELKNKLCVLKNGSVLDITLTGSGVGGTYDTKIINEIIYDGKVCDHENSIYYEESSDGKILRLYKKP